MPNNSLRDVILARLAAIGDVQPHPSQGNASGTKYISAFIRSNGTTFAVDKMSGSEQPIWLLDHPRLRSCLDAAAIEYEVYPPERGRNSNLHKLPNFKEGQLLRIYPQTLEEALEVVRFIGQAPAQAEPR
jgi:hypothetical protein